MLGGRVDDAAAGADACTNTATTATIIAAEYAKGAAKALQKSLKRKIERERNDVMNIHLWKEKNL